MSVWLRIQQSSPTCQNDPAEPERKHLLHIWLRSCNTLRVLIISTANMINWGGSMRPRPPLKRGFGFDRRWCKSKNWEMILITWTHTRMYARVSCNGWMDFIRGEWLREVGGSWMAFMSCNNKGRRRTWADKFKFLLERHLILRWPVRHSSYTGGLEASRASISWLHFFSSLFCGKGYELSSNEKSRSDWQYAQ